MNVRGNILIIWQGWKPNLQTSTFWHTISLSLPPLYPPSTLWFHHLISHPSCHRDLLNPTPPSPVRLFLSSSLSLKCHLHFPVHILGLVLPVDGLILPGPRRHLYGSPCSLRSPAGDDETRVYVRVQRGVHAGACITRHYWDWQCFSSVPKLVLRGRHLRAETAL